MRWFVLALLAGCATESYDLDMYWCHDGCEDVRPIGIGGRVGMYARGADGRIVEDADVQSSDPSVLTVEVRDPGSWWATGVGAGQAELVVLGPDGSIQDHRSVEVGDMKLELDGVTGPLLDDTYDAAFRAGTEPFVLGLRPEVHGVPSYGTHYFIARLDGEQYNCYYSGICTGGVYYDHIQFGSLPAGDHVLELSATDSSQHLTYRIIAQ